MLLEIISKPVMNLSVSNRFFHAAVDPLPALILQNGQLIISYQRMNGFASHRFTEQDTGPACQPSPAHPVQQVKVMARVRYSRPGELIGGHLRQPDAWTDLPLHLPSQ